MKKKKIKFHYQNPSDLKVFVQGGQPYWFSPSVRIPCNDQKQSIVLGIMEHSLEQGGSEWGIGKLPGLLLGIEHGLKV